MLTAVGSTHGREVIAEVFNRAGYLDRQCGDGIRLSAWVELFVGMIDGHLTATTYSNR